MINYFEMRNIILNEILVPSLVELYAVDYDNIRNGVSERNICARLAHHMENLMRRYDQINNEMRFWEYYADVEYNRMGNGDLKHYESSEHRPVYMVSDLLIQKRVGGRNLLAVEMKRKGNHRHVAKDKERIMSLVSSPKNYEEEGRCVHDTLVGAFIEYSKKGVMVELYENIDGRGVKTEDIKLVYKQDAYNRGHLVRVYEQ